jgi:hypothetical protein
MLEESLGRGERRATAIVLSVLFVEALWVFLHKYLPLDAALWSLQADLVRAHISGNTGDAWRMIPIPAANVGVPLFTGLLDFLFSGEVVVRLLLSFVGIFARGGSIVILFRVMRVRDEAVYYLIPVLAWSGLWFAGALPYLVGETVVFLTIAYFLTQQRPGASAYGIILFGVGLAAFCHGLAWITAALVIIAVAREQRRSVHLSQGWLSSSRSVVLLAAPGLAIIALALFTAQPIFRVTTSNLLPSNGLGFLLFIASPVPTVLEGMLRGTDIFQIVISIALLITLLGFFARAFLLAMEEVTWQSRALRSAGFILLLISLAGVYLKGFGLDTSALLGSSTLLILAGAYSRGPAVRRTLLDRLLLTIALTTMIVTGLFNAYSLNRGSDATTEVIKTARTLITQERQSAKDDERIDSLRFSFALDSSLAQLHAGYLVGTYSYSLAAPIYLFGANDLLHDQTQFQPAAGCIRPKESALTRTSPTDPIVFSSPEKYIDPHFRVLALLPVGVSTSPTFGPYGYTLTDTNSSNFSRGLAEYRIAVGKLSPHHPTGLASR